MSELLMVSLGILSLAAGAAAVRWPLAGLLGYVWLDFMRPQDTWPALAAARPMLALAVGMLLAALRDALARPTRAEAKWRDWTGVVGLCAAVVPASLLNALASDVAAARVVAALAPIKLALVAWLLVRVLRQRRDFDLVLLVIAGSLTVLGLNLIRESIGAVGPYVAPQGPGGAGVGVFGDNNDLARGLLLGMALWSAFAVPMVRRRRVAVAAALLVLAVMVEAVVLTGSRGGFVALAVSGTYLLFAYLRPLAAAVASLALMAFLLRVATPAPIAARIATIAKPTAQASVQSRVDIWREGLRLALARPVFGHGLGTFAVPHAKGPAHPPRSAHNVFVELFYEVGAVGLAAYLFLLAQTFVRLRVLRAPPSTEPWLRSRAIALEAALIAFTVASLGLSHAFLSIPFVVVGLSIALRRLVRAPAG